MVANHKYAWTIIQDYRAVDTAPKGTGNNATGIVGPAGADRSHEEIVNDPAARHFRLSGPAGVCYEGMIVGSAEGPEPLDDFGRSHGGCTSIEYLESEPLWRSMST